MRKTLKRATAFVIIQTFRISYRTIRASYKAYTAIRQWRIDSALRHRRLSNAQRSHMVADDSSQEGSPFLCLPLELRLRIYTLALTADGKLFKGERCILQPAVDRKSMYLSHYGSYPSSWEPRQHIRSDDGPPAKGLPLLLALGGSAKAPHVAPPRRGCVRYGVSHRMLCGGEQGMLAWKFFNQGNLVCHITDLLRVCRTMYREALPLLYGDNTISLFGAEMVLFFVRNVGSDGLGCIQNVHLIIRLDAARWAEDKKKDEVLRAVQCVRERFASLNQLDIEVVVTWGQPTEPDVLWAWLMEEVFATLGGLGEFVLKASVLQPLKSDDGDRHGCDDWTPKPEALSSWNDADYKALQVAVMRLVPRVP